MKNHYQHLAIAIFRILMNPEAYLGQIQASHSVKSVRIWSYSSPHFPAFGLNTVRYSVSRDTPHLSVFSRNAGKCGPE